jgi:hypothetical protein
MSTQLSSGHHAQSAMENINMNNNFSAFDQTQQFYSMNKPHTAGGFDNRYSSATVDNRRV